MSEGLKWTELWRKGLLWDTDVKVALAAPQWVFVCGSAINIARCYATNCLKKAFLTGVLNKVAIIFHKVFCAVISMGLWLLLLKHVLVKIFKECFVFSIHRFGVTSMASSCQLSQKNILGLALKNKQKSYSQ